ncbi:hypothetical protein AB0N17_03385 [Streptomyces sp. NPDC051133]|uniref:hypothetical protein n=1 Tax=Streptomyces sp. NPDC051133 TaxID=3155521 RepID=UPI00343EA228
MAAVSLAGWAAFLSLGLSISAAGAIPVLLWVDADYLLVADWQAVGDRVLVEIVRASHTVRAVPVTAAALLMLLSPAAPEVAR